jgi:hypothetical protein
MAVTAASDGGVCQAAFEAVLNGDAGPMVHGMDKQVMTGLSSEHDAALALPLG